MDDNVMECTSCHVEQDVKEIKIPLGYGYIAAREWGKSSGDRCLALHGWQDNAGSFDKLIPCLSSKLYIIAIDMIGHGLSSHKPIGDPYFYLEFIYHVKCIAEYLNWNKFTIIGHSFGSSIGFVFASLYPDMINKLVSIDLVKPLTYAVSVVSALIKSNLQTYKDAEKKTVDTQPSYSEEEILKHFIKGRSDAILEQSARTLLKRGTKKLNNGKFVFSRDIRVKDIWGSGLNCIAIITEVISDIKCDLLIIKAKDSLKYSDEASINHFLEIYKKQCSKFEFVEIDGNHFVHLDHPDYVAPFINRFLLQKQSYL